MQYIKTNLSYDDFTLLIEAAVFDSLNKHTGDTQQLSRLCDSELISEFCGYPDFYYFGNLDGKAYVLEENESEDSTVIYEVAEVEDANGICEHILRDTLSERKNKNNYLAQYNLLELNYGKETYYVVGESCMHSNEGWSQRLPEQEDMLYTIKQNLVSRHTESFNEYEQLLQSEVNTEFGNKLALSNREKESKAIHWIERCKSLDELNGLLLPDGRNMVKITKHEPISA